MTVDSDAISVTCKTLKYQTDIATESFFSATSKYEDPVPVMDQAQEEAAIKAFCLDIGKLEKAVSRTNGGVGCRIHRPVSFEKASHFVFQATFVDGTVWDVIIPHPNPFHVSPSVEEKSFYHHGLAAVNGAMPKLLGWRASPENDAGIPYIIVNSTKGIPVTTFLTSGYEHWMYMDWICYACALRVAELEREQAGLKFDTPSTSMSSSSSFMKSRRTTEETDRTEVSKVIKSVRFGADEVFKFAEIAERPESVDIKPETWKTSVTRKFRFVARCIRNAGRKIERPLITFLMKIGF